MFSIRTIYLLFLYLFFLAATSAFAESNCITCHTDEEMLTKNLAKVDEKKSSMQSGTG
jgi:hypothetical protein